MKLKIPFLNMKNYVLLKCYHKNPLVVERAPIVLSNKLSPLKKPEQPVSSFATCYGYIASLKRSATIVANTDFEWVVEENNINYNFADPHYGEVEWRHDGDLVYSTITNKHSPLVVSKIRNFWHLEEDTGVDFVMASHIRNTTAMRIPTGILNFKHQHTAAIFNILTWEPQHHVVNYKTPLVSLHPLTDKPLYVESICDQAKVEELDIKTTSHPYFSGSCLKLSKNKY